MSHFTVAIIFDKEPNRYDISDVLMPFHEFECTGYDNKYVQDIDNTSEVIEEFNSCTDSFFKDSEGNFYPPWDSQFSDSSGNEVIPVGFTKLTGNISEYMTIYQWVKLLYNNKIVEFNEEPSLQKDHKYEYFKFDKDKNLVKYIKRTNPNKKWDWYSVGGRWDGFFKKKGSSEKVNIIKKSDIDFEYMENEDIKSSSIQWHKVRNIINPYIDGFNSWSNILDLYNNDYNKCREVYNSQPLVMALLKAGENDSELFFIKPEDYFVSYEQFIEDHKNKSLTTFAFIKNGKWFEKGEMGWWACVSNEKDKEIWNKEFFEMIKELPMDSWLCVVDCHI